MGYLHPQQVAERVERLFPSHGGGGGPRLGNFVEAVSNGNVLQEATIATENRDGDVTLAYRYPSCTMRFWDCHERKAGPLAAPLPGYSTCGSHVIQMGRTSVQSWRPCSVSPHPASDLLPTNNLQCSMPHEQLVSHPKSALMEA
jgi:hypothetical protein